MIFFYQQTYKNDEIVSYHIMITTTYPSESDPNVLKDKYLYLQIGKNLLLPIKQTWTSSVQGNSNVYNIKTDAYRVIRIRSAKRDTVYYLAGIEMKWHGMKNLTNSMFRLLTNEASQPTSTSAWRWRGEDEVIPVTVLDPFVPHRPCRALKLVGHSRGTLVILVYIAAVPI